MHRTPEMILNLQQRKKEEGQMLLVQENIVKLGGVILSGQCKKISIDETATIENIEDDKGKTKATQPTGYEAAKISIDFILEDSTEMTQDEQITAMQRLFKAYHFIGIGVGVTTAIDVTIALTLEGLVIPHIRLRSHKKAAGDVTLIVHDE